MTRQSSSSPTAGEAPWVLAGDIGGTKCVLGLYQVGPAGLVPGRRGATPSAGHSSVEGVIGAFLAEGPPTALAAVCLGVAGPVSPTGARLLNLAWPEIAVAELSARLGAPVALINDLVATAEGIDALGQDDFATLQQGQPDPDGTRVVIAAGTGLGMAICPLSDGQRVVVPSEGGHMDWAPQGPRQVRLYEALEARYGHVSVERAASGLALADLYRFASAERGAQPDLALMAALDAGDGGAALTRAAQTDEGADLALDLLVEIYGAAAGNLALVAWATGGVYVGGGIAPKQLQRILRGHFLRAYRAKGRYTESLSSFPVKVILNQDTALLGAATCAARIIDTGRR